MADIQQWVIYDDVLGRLVLSSDPDFPVQIMTMAGKTLHVNVSPRTRVRELKNKINDKESIATGDQLLISGGTPLLDEMTMAGCGIERKSTLHLFSVSELLVLMGTRHVGGCMEVDARMLDPTHNFDFTNKMDGRVFRRGGEIYRRPCGWKRYALAVSGKYENDDWLDDNPHGLGWPVAYHGTSKENAKAITETGFLMSEGKRFGYGRGIYTSPDIETASGYSTPFSYNGQQYKVVVQNRVNPKTLRKVAENKNFWLSPNEGDVRPYGLLIKNMSTRSGW